MTERHLAILRWIACAALVAAGVALTVSNLVPIGTLRAATEEDLERQEQTNRRLEQRLLEVDAQTERALRDPWTNERMLRDEYRMSRPGEILVK